MLDIFIHLLPVQQRSPTFLVPLCDPNKNYTWPWELRRRRKFLGAVSRQKETALLVSQLSAAGWGCTRDTARSWVSWCPLASAASAGFLLSGAGHSGWLSSQHQSLSTKYVASPWHRTWASQLTNHRFAIIYISWIFFFFPVTMRVRNHFLKMKAGNCKSACL